MNVFRKGGLSIAFFTYLSADTNKTYKKTSELHTEQQLADSFVLIFHLKGDGAISIGTSSLPLQKETLYICPPFETFGIFPVPQKKSVSVWSDCTPILMTPIKGP